MDETLARNTNDMEADENETLPKKQAHSTDLGVKGTTEAKPKPRPALKAKPEKELEEYAAPETRPRLTHVYFYGANNQNKAPTRRM